MVHAPVTGHQGFPIPATRSSLKHSASMTVTVAGRTAVLTVEHAGNAVIGRSSRGYEGLKHWTDQNVTGKHLDRRVEKIWMLSAWTSGAQQGWVCVFPHKLIVPPDHLGCQRVIL